MNGSRPQIPNEPCKPRIAHDAFSGYVVQPTFIQLVFFVLARIQNVVCIRGGEIQGALKLVVFGYVFHKGVEFDDGWESLLRLDYFDYTDERWRHFCEMQIRFIGMFDNLHLTKVFQSLIWYDFRGLPIYFTFFFYILSVQFAILF